ncbi:hypothetical protein BGZ68_009243, partial [Mortierella alpina]
MKVAKLEETAEKYTEMLEFLHSNGEFFTNMATNLDPRLQKLETEVKRSPLSRAELGRLFHDHKTDVTNTVGAIV